MQDEALIEVKEEMLAPSLGSLQRGAAQLVDAAGLPTQRASGARDLDIRDPPPTKGILQSASRAVDRVTLGHPVEARAPCPPGLYPTPAAHGGTFCQLAGLGPSGVAGRSSPRVM